MLQAPAKFWAQVGRRLGTGTAPSPALAPDFTRVIEG